MERKDSKEKGVESERKKQQGLMVKKLKQGVLVSKRGGLCSTPPPIWRLDEFDTNSQHKNSSEFLNLHTSTSLSARNLCSSLWEIGSFNYHHNPLSQMSKEGCRIRQKPQRRNGFGVTSSPHDQEPASSSTLRRLVSASLVQHHQSVESNDCALQPLSPASCSSMEVTPYRGGMADSSRSLKTSTELLKVLNRIWSLEEQHASNISLVKALKMELDHSQARVKELLHEKHSDRQEMDDLMKHVTENKLVWKNSKDQDRIKAKVQLLRDELEGERKLRKHSESLHRKLARELSEVKSSFSNALRELERERKARILLENLCDEFANGVKEYEQEVRALKQKPEKDQSDMTMTSSDRLILHLSEAWLDERMQMKIAEAQNNVSESNTIVEKLGLDIETFLQAKRAVESKQNCKLTPKELTGNCSRRHSLESFPLNEAISAPELVADGDSSDSDSRCLEASKSAGGKPLKVSSRLVRSNSVRRKASQGQFEGRISCNKSRSAEREHCESTEMGEQNRGLIENLEQYEYCDLMREGLQETQSNQVAGQGLKPNHPCVQSVYTGNASPVQQWMSKLTTPDFGKSESCLEWPPDVNENTLMAKLLEARLEAKRSRTKTARGTL